MRDLVAMSDNDSLDHLTEIDEALARHSPTLDAAIDTVVDQRVSDYPITVWQRGAEVELGVALIADAEPGHWEIRMTTLEEMAARKVLLPERVSEFRKVFTDAAKRYCLFVVTPEGARFAFRPRQ